MTMLTVKQARMEKEQDRKWSVQEPEIKQEVLICSKDALTENRRKTNWSRIMTHNDVEVWFKVLEQFLSVVNGIAPFKLIYYKQITQLY